MSRKKKIGRISETRVREWAEINDAAVNNSDPDEFGWDHYIEFESTVYHETLSGLHTSPMKCKAQIKATDSVGGNRQLSLSALKHVATDTNPAFIVFIEYYKKNKPKKIYLTHIDKDISYEILSRCAKAKNKGKELNKSTYKIPDKYRKNIERPFGKNLFSSIKGNIGSSMESYQQNKVSYLSNMGFESANIKATFTIENIDKAIRQSLHGSEQYIKVDKFNHTVNRFGVAEEPVELNRGELWIKLIARDKPLTAKLYVEKDDGIGGLEFDVNVITPKLNTLVPDSKQVALIEGACFDITFNILTNDGEVKITERADRRVPMHELVNYFHLMKLISTTKGHRKFKIKIVSSKNDEKKNGYVNVGEPQNSIDVSAEIRTLEKMISVCSSETAFSNVRITLGEYRQNIGHLGRTFEKYEALIKEVRGDQLGAGLLKCVEKSDKYTILINLVCPIGDHYFTSLITASSSEIDHIEEAEILLNGCEVDIHLQDLVHNQKVNALYKSKIAQKIQKIVVEKHNDGYAVIIPTQALS